MPPGARPRTRPGDIVVLNNLSSHQRAAACLAVKAVGAHFVFFPHCSPDFNSTEKAFAKLKALICKATERTVAGHSTRIGTLVGLFTPKECANYGASRGHDSD
jgi:transposase